MMPVKKIGGRKRHIVVDTEGRIIAAIVHEANIQDRDGAKLILPQLKDKFPRLELIWADGGYAGKLIQWVKDNLGYDLEIIKRSDDTKGFKILPRRWVVERTFGWFNRFRRLSKDFENLSENIMYIAMISILIRRLRALSPMAWHTIFSAMIIICPNGLKLVRFTCLL